LRPATVRLAPEDATNALEHLPTTAAGRHGRPQIGGRHIDPLVRARTVAVSSRQHAHDLEEQADRLGRHPVAGDEDGTGRDISRHRVVIGGPLAPAEGQPIRATST